MQMVTPIDHDDSLSYEDTLVLRDMIQRRMAVWGAIGASLATALYFVNDESPVFTIEDWFICSCIWLGITLFKFFELQFIINRNAKKVTRGRIMSRYEAPGMPRRRHGQEYYYFEINGRKISVPRTIYKRYFTNDVVEFHYAGRVFLREKLLERTGHPSGVTN